MTENISLHSIIFSASRVATIEQILKVRRIDQNQFNWPDLDIDIDTESLERPENYPLIYKK